MGALFEHPGVMLDAGKGLVEMMQQRAPFLVLRGLPKALGVVFQGLPIDQQGILRWVLQAALQLVREIARHADDDRGGLAKGRFERRLAAGNNLQYGEFKNHLSLAGGAV